MPEVDGVEGWASALDVEGWGECGDEVLQDDLLDGAEQRKVVGGGDQLVGAFEDPEVALEPLVELPVGADDGLVDAGVGRFLPRLSLLDPVGRFDGRVLAGLCAGVDLDEHGGRRRGEVRDVDVKVEGWRQDEGQLGFKGRRRGSAVAERVEVLQCHLGCGKELLKARLRRGDPLRKTRGRWGLQQGEPRIVVGQCQDGCALVQGSGGGIHAVWQVQDLIFFNVALGSSRSNMRFNT